jgi:hypothetical protein
MVLSTLLIAAFSLVRQQNDGSILSKLVPTPTGRNGYEEYLRAVDIVGTGGWSVYENWINYKQKSAGRKSPAFDDDENLPELPPGVSREMPELLIRKVADERLGVAYDIVREGNEKKVYDPRLEYRYDTLVPELSRFRSLAKLGTNRAYLDFADGKTKQAVADLLEGLKFSSKIHGISRICAIVANAVQTIDLGAFEEHLGQLSMGDCEQIEKACTAFIVAPPDVSLIFRYEREMARSSLDDVFEKSDAVLPSEDQRNFGAAFKGLGAGDRQQLRSMVEPALDQRWTEEEQRLNGPESRWLMQDNSEDRVAATSDTSVSNLALLFVEDVLPKSMQRQFARSLSRSRIQLRLLRLHAKVLEYHWLYNRWPTNIEEFANPNTAFDPFEGAAFHYERQVTGYRLYSLGVPGMGPIELKYKAVATSAPVAGSPPPSR